MSSQVSSDESEPDDSEDSDYSEEFDDRGSSEDLDDTHDRTQMHEELMDLQYSDAQSEGEANGDVPNDEPVKTDRDQSDQTDYFEDDEDLFCNIQLKKKGSIFCTEWNSRTQLYEHLHIKPYLTPCVILKCVNMVTMPLSAWKYLIHSHKSSSRPNITANTYQRLSHVGPDKSEDGKRIYPKTHGTTLFVSTIEDLDEYN